MVDCTYKLIDKLMDGCRYRGANTEGGQGGGGSGPRELNFGCKMMFYKINLT